MRKIIVIIALFMMIGALLGACAGDDQPGGQSAQPTVTPIPTAPAAARPTYVVQRGTVQDVLSLTGRWLPRDQTKLSFEVSGTISSVYVQSNDTVHAGQLLAEYQITDLENQLASALLNLETAQMQLASGTEGTTESIVNAEFALASANINLASTRDNAPWTSLESARLGLETARRNLEDAQRAYDDARSHPENPASAVDSAYQQLQSAQDQVESAELQYYSAGQNFNNYLYSVENAENTVIQQQMNLAQAQQSGGDPQLAQSVRSAQMQVDQIREQIYRSSLFAPMDGVVLEVTISPGDAVQAYTPVITIAIPQPLEVIAYPTFSEIEELDVNMVGTCQVMNRPETKVLCAVRRQPFSTQDADQSVRIGAMLEDWAILNQLIEVEMPLQVQENVLWLPPEAVRQFQNRMFVTILTADGERVSDVTIGLQTDDRWEIISGVSEGDVVVGP